MTKMLDMARPSGPSGSRSPHVVTRPVELNVVEFLKARRYRERVDEEIGKASERGARWWSRRLVQLYEAAGLVRLDK